MTTKIVCLIWVTLALARAQQLLFSDEFDILDVSKWTHEKTMGGGGNWEFEIYQNNRTTSYTRNGVLYITPGLTADLLGVNGEQLVKSGYTHDIWGASPADLCTGNAFFGCKRESGVSYTEYMMSQI